MKIPKINLQILNRRSETEPTDFSDIYPALLANSINGQQRTKHTKINYPVSVSEKTPAPKYDNPVVTRHSIHDVPYAAESITMTMSQATGSMCRPISREEKFLMTHGNDSSFVTVTHYCGKEHAEIRIYKK